ncbi:MAG: efflux RND transporter periplasmic adaptor subunit, partial [Xanthobacteraceae bacterium]|nr:efflux RND transporter periplasmic adaptor subunit [Xanthobacteraceae bacterium]
MRHWRTGVVVVAAVAAGAVAFSAIRLSGTLGGAARAATAPPAFVMPVPVVSVVKKPVPVYREYTARTEAIRSISILPRISGYVSKQDTPDGTDVNEGELLYTIDTRDMQAALDQVKAQMVRDKAALEYARSNLNRGAALVGNGFLAKDVYDQRMSASGQAEAVLAMDEAALRPAELNLSYAQVRAPFSGRLGRNQASVGALVSPGGSALNTLVQLS